ncbi:MAG: hypothetical protein QOH68_3928, partial [Nocardioidaceae bacterium]|nr:hypothetical protein [Nocardioidaceae bacterium]
GTAYGGDPRDRLRGGPTVTDDLDVGFRIEQLVQSQT